MLEFNWNIGHPVGVAELLCVEKSSHIWWPLVQYSVRKGKKRVFPRQHQTGKKTETFGKRGPKLLLLGSSTKEYVTYITFKRFNVNSPKIN